MPLINEETAEGEIFTGKRKKFSWERIWAFSGGAFRPEGWPSKNIHTDLEFAQSCGMSSIAASATQFMGHVVELMIDLFGVEWLSYGRMDNKFLKPVDSGDILVCKATVRAREKQDKATKFVLDIGTDNQNGEKVLVGSASCFLGKVAPAQVDGDYDSRLKELMAIGVEPEKLESLEYVLAEGRSSLEPLQYLVTPELNQQFLYSEEDFHPRYIEESEIGLPLVHPGLLLNWSNSTRSPSFKIHPGQWGLHARDETFFYNPAKVGKKIICLSC